MITIYGKPNCTFCDQAITLCEMMSVPFEYKSLGEHFDVDWLITHFQNNYGVTPKAMPQIINDERYIGGFKELKQALNA